MKDADADALRRLYAEHGGTMADSADAIQRELARESDDRVYIVALALEGLSLREIGKQMEISHGSVRSRLELTMRAVRRRIEQAPARGGYRTGATENRLPDAIRAEALRLAAEGTARAAICAKLKISKASLSRWLKEDSHAATA